MSADEQVNRGSKSKKVRNDIIHNTAQAHEAIGYPSIIKDAKYVFLKLLTRTGAGSFAKVKQLWGFSANSLAVKYKYRLKTPKQIHFFDKQIQNLWQE